MNARAEEGKQPPFKLITAAVAIFFAFLILIRFLWFARSIFLVTILGILFGITLARGVDHLEKWKIKRRFGAPLLVLLFLGLLVGLGFLLAPTLKKQSVQLREKLPAAVDKIEEWTGIPKGDLTTALQQSAQGGQTAEKPEQGKPAEKPAEKPATEPAAKPPEKPGESPAGTANRQQQQQQPAPSGTTKPAAQSGTGGSEQQATQQKGGAQKEGESAAAKGRLRDTLGQNLGRVGNFLFPVVSATVAIIGGIIYVIFLALFIAVDPKLYRHGLVHLFPPARRKRTAEILEELGETLRQWLLARLIAMAVVGAITGIGLALLKIPAAAALGVIAGLLEFIPFLGPIIASIPAMGMGLVVSPAKAASVAVLFLIIQQLEGNVLTPLLLKNRLDVPPAVTIVAVSAAGVMFGILGMLIAEPLSAAAIVLVRRLYIERLEQQPAE